ncbi:YggS family pyridoxal phosphate-dependent enzyme [Serinibacter arcticus]|uniref:Pyridoxal phosphate homeostasis protein n=1 Tax=Serinibacter arcticus TaxID=1655435 RepID=A0A2U1ZVP2_9MICO|nr:YggS family pyridoxal phosphate-dependent enzyme [Serinibacter arcticus]PWD50992.1 YggS family pyridoxal phosphate-dependent enzyme [Serinibacter arcticus]
MGREELEQRLAAVRRRIDDAARSAGRDPAAVRLLAVSKTVPAAVVRLAFEAGCHDLGESRAQELAGKVRELADVSPRWVFLGPVQTNKARDVARDADELHSLDRLELAVALQRRLEMVDRSLDVLVQVNTSGEAEKSGVAPGDLTELVRAVAPLDRLRVRGLMTIAPRGGDLDAARRCFRELATLAERVRGEAVDGVGMDELSMGMSGDLEAAIAEGATTVRVGTALFGTR